MSLTKDLILSNAQFLFPDVINDHGHFLDRPTMSVSDVFYVITKTLPADTIKTRCECRQVTASLVIRAPEDPLAFKVAFEGAAAPFVEEALAKLLQVTMIMIAEATKAGDIPAMPVGAGALTFSGLGQVNRDLHKEYIFTDAS
ncbi:hypothetical protein LTR37_012252 [Vermiconidia calcicola]|uniref:Uncharacterized protein n=1 Tax=Vermiconidia calcicola TaxID=1690605 RepID=A0ACC3N124_9PEZI|nr:hypothetical protein LTR37_012252 [Vermiconidia calcicola]